METRLSVHADKRDERDGRPAESARSDGGPPRPGPSGSPGAAMRRHPSFLLAPVICLMTLALVAGLARSPTYTASSRLAVGGLSSTSPSELMGFADAAQQLAQTYSRSVQGDAVVAEVARRMHAGRDEVSSHLSAAPIPETPVFTLSATSHSAEGAIRLSNLASQALASEVSRASQATAPRLLGQYRAAALEREQLSKRVDALSATHGPGLAAAQSELLAVEARADSLRTAYAASQQNASVPLQIIERADSAGSDRLSVLELYLFVALVFGLVIGAALAFFRDTPAYEKVIRALAALRERYKSRPDRVARARRGSAGRSNGRPGPMRRSPRRMRP